LGEEGVGVKKKWDFGKGEVEEFAGDFVFKFTSSGKSGGSEGGTSNGSGGGMTSTST
jgi:hypothetical protein